MAHAAVLELDTGTDGAEKGIDSGRDLDILVRTIEDLAHTRSLEDIAAVVRMSARVLSGADGITFVLREGDQCHYLDEDAVGPLWKGLRFPLSACISGWAMLNRKTAVIPDIYADPRIPHDAYRPTFVKSLVMTPVGRDQPEAAIGAYWSTLRQPTVREIAALSAIARATATAIENVRLVGSLTESLERRDFLIRELDHRVKNMLASVQAVARQTLKTAPDQASFVEAFNGRLMALSRAHVLLTRDAWKGARLSAIVTEALAPFRDAGERVSVSGSPSVKLGPVEAVAAHLALHELITNAVSYGALSNDGGTAAVDWRVEAGPDGRRLVLAWAESGGPVVASPQRRGMGMRLIEQGLAHALGGEVALDFAPSGLRLRLTAPLSPSVQIS